MKLFALILAFAASGCMTFRTLEEAAETPLPGMGNSELLRCRVAQDTETGALRMALTLKTPRRDTIHVGDTTWFAAHPEARLEPVAVGYEVGGAIRLRPIQLSGDGGALSDRDWDLEKSREARERLLVVIDRSSKSALKATVYWPQGLQLASPGRPAGRFHEAVRFPGRARVHAKRLGLYALTPLTAAADVLLFPVSVAALLSS